jgi:hypothetical protein
VDSNFFSNTFECIAVGKDGKNFVFYSAREEEMKQWLKDLKPILTKVQDEAFEQHQRSKKAREISFSLSTFSFTPQ